MTLLDAGGAAGPAPRRPLRYRRVIDLIDEIIAGARERRRLELPGRAQIVRLRGVIYRADELPFDCFEQTYPAHDFAFWFSGRTSRRLVPAGELNGWRDTGTEGRGR